MLNLYNIFMSLENHISKHDNKKNEVAPVTTESSLVGGPENRAEAFLVEPEAQKVEKLEALDFEAKGMAAEDRRQAEILLTRMKDENYGKTLGVKETNLEEPKSESFAASLEPTNFDARNVRLWQPRGDSSKLVREMGVADGQTIETLEKSMSEGKFLFELLRDKYGLKVVSMDTRVDKNIEGQEVVFTTVDKIGGQNLFEVKNLPEEAKEELEALHISLGHYYSDAWKQKLKYWGDARSDQFVYGSKDKEKENHFYLTDVDPEFYQEGDDKWHTIEAVLGSVCHDLIENESKFEPKVRFDRARQELLKIVDEILTKEPDKKMLIEAKGWLES